MFTNILVVAALAASALAHGDYEHQIPIAGPHKALWYNTLPGDGGTQVYHLIPDTLCEAALTLDRPILSFQVSRHLVVCHITHALLPTM